MNIKSLLESSAQYVNRQKEATDFVNDFRGSGLLEGLKNEQEVSNMAMILHNQAKRLVSEGNTTGTGAPGYHGENWNDIALPLVRRVFGEIKAKDFLSVQPMSMPSGLIFYLDIKYGSDKNPFTKGSSLYGNQSDLHPNVKDVDVDGGFFGAGRFGYTLNQFSAAVTTVVAAATAADVNFDTRFDLTTLKKVTIPAPTDAELSSSRAFLVTSATIPAASILQGFTKVVGSNLVFITNSATAASSAGTIFYNKRTTETSRGDYEDGSTNAVPNTASSTKIVIPELDIKLKQESIVAKTRRLKAQWTPEFSQDLDAYHNIDAENELTSMLSQYITMEVDLELIDMLMDAAATKAYWSAKNNTFFNGQTNSFETANTGEVTTSGFNGYYNQQGTWFQTIGTTLSNVSNKIRQKTMIAGANFILVPISVATIFESMPGFASDAKADDSEFGFGVQKVGSFNSRWKVYVNPFAKDNTILMGYKGAQFAETGAAYCPYVPLIMTPLVYDPETFTPRKGLMTRYAKKVVRPEFYGKVYVSGLDSLGF